MIGYVDFELTLPTASTFEKRETEVVISQALGHGVYKVLMRYDN